MHKVEHTMAWIEWKDETPVSIIKVRPAEPISLELPARIGKKVFENIS